MGIESPPMATAIITGSGTYSLPGFGDENIEQVETPFGSVEVSRGDLAGQEVLHVSRHGTGHVRLSSQVTHRANIWALHALGAEAVVGCTVCGAVAEVTLKVMLPPLSVVPFAGFTWALPDATNRVTLCPAAG